MTIVEVGEISSQRKKSQSKAEGIEFTFAPTLVFSTNDVLIILHVSFLENKDNNFLVGIGMGSA